MEIHCNRMLIDMQTISYVSADAAFGFEVFFPRLLPRSTLLAVPYAV
jgi:hypothetical protein